jgi:hypothetical protein
MQRGARPKYRGLYRVGYVSSAAGNNMQGGEPRMRLIAGSITQEPLQEAKGRCALLPLFPDAVRRRGARARARARRGEA